MLEQPVLTFLTSLRHFDTTDDYPRVEELLGATLRSLDAQTDRRCQAIVVANRPFAVPADIRMPVEVLTVDFPAPPDWAGPTRPRQAGVRLDRGAKMAVALSRVAGGHVMYVDADDAVSRRLVAFVAAHADRPGWFVTRGIRYDVANGLYRRQREFNTVCGTSLIFDRSLLPAIDLPAGVSRDDVVEAVGEDRVLYELGSHRHLKERYELEPLPFPGAVYCVNNGQNVSRKSQFALGRPLTRSIAEDFGIDRRPPAAMWRAALASLGPVTGQAILTWLRDTAAGVRARLGKLRRVVGGAA